jgi:ribonucleoside-triphosphate reductase
MFDDPTSPDAVLITFPVAYEEVEFDVVDGKDVNLESAIDQLNRYKMLMDCYVDHNCSITVSYSLDEVPAIRKWLLENWESYVGVSFLYRNDPTKTAKDLGYLYLPQEVVTKEAYEAYVAILKPLPGVQTQTNDGQTDFEVDAGTECATGACPVR